MKFKRAQEEMVGFGVILILVAVILLVFFWFMVSRPAGSSVQNYEVESLLRASLAQTTACKDRLDYLDVEGLIFACAGDERCDGGEDSCAVLDTILTDLYTTSLRVGEDSVVKGYSLNIIANDEELLMKEEGNQTGNAKGAVIDRQGGRRKEARITLEVFEADALS